MRDDPPHELVDVRPAQVVVDEPLPQRLELQRAELRRRRPAVQLAQRPDHPHDAVILAGLGRPVVALGVPDVVGGQLDDGQIVLRRAERRRPARRQQLGDQPIVLALAGLRAVRAEVVIAAVERDDGLPGRPVLPVLGQRLNETSA